MQPPAYRLALNGFLLFTDCFGLTCGFGIRPVSSADAAAWVGSIEHAYRRIEALRVQTLEAVEAGRWHSTDVRFSPKKMLEYHRRLSHGSAQAVEATHRMFVELGEIQAVFDTGDLGVDHVKLLAKVYSNKRARPAMFDAQPWFLEQAKLLPYRDFAQVVREWERLVDADGARDRDQTSHENRNATLAQDPFSLAWRLEGHRAALAGSEIKHVLRACVKAKYEAD